MARKGVTAVGAILLFLAFFLPWLSTSSLVTGSRMSLSLWNVYSLVMGGDIGYYIGGVVTQDSLMTIVLVMYPFGLFAALLLLGNYDFSVAYPAGLVFAAVAVWFLELYSHGLTLAPGSLTGPYLALAGGILILASVKRSRRRYLQTR
jgi:hypothetical protein